MHCNFKLFVMSLLFVNLWCNNRLFRLTRQPLQRQRSQKLLLIGIRSAALAYVYLFARLTTQASGHAHLGAHCGTDFLPAVVNALGLQFASNLMHQVVGQERNEDVAFYAVSLLVVNRAHTKF